MPITALPQNTVRALGSSQVLTDSASLVKELIDNAIDGRATIIAVEISSNTLDDIRVKDNGHGIAQEDRALACLMHCTSKITTLDELKEIGGRSLGFRGQALASAAEMSKDLTISTRIEGEQTAAEIKFDRHGKIASEKRTSLPIGTTVRVEKFLETLPVRRQAAEKTTAKSLAKIKRLMQAYALAKPHLRLSFKVMKAKNEKANWKYPKSAVVGPSKSTASIFNAAVDVVGKQVTDQCQRVLSTWSCAGEQIDIPVADEIREAPEDTFELETILANPGCDASIISHVGQFLSVDSRPVSCARGTMKQIASMYKSYLRSTLATNDTSKLTYPFLCMNIVCPRGSYDVNVEPAKDEVLFSNGDLVRQLAEKHFKNLYGEVGKDSPRLSTSKAAPKPSGIEILLARKHPPILQDSLLPRPPLQDKCDDSRVSPDRQATISERPAHSPSLSLAPNFPITSQTSNSPKRNLVPDPVVDQDERCSENVSNVPSRSSNQNSAKRMVPHPKISPWKTSMYADDDEGENSEVNESPSSAALPTIEDEIEEERHLKNVHVSNPWAFAKLNAPFRPPTHNNRHEHPDTESNLQLLTPARQPGDAGNGVGQFPTPAADGRTTGRLRRRLADEENTSSPPPFPFPLKARARRTANEELITPARSERERYGRGSLDTWVRKSLGSSPESTDASTAEDTLGRSHGPPDIERAYAGPFVSARSLPTGTPLSEIPDVSERPRRKAPQRQGRGNINKPYISPVNDPERVWFETGEPRRRKPQHQPRPRPAQHEPDSLVLREDDDAESVTPNYQHLPPTPIHPDLAQTMDYEARKLLATQQHRQSLRQQALKPAPAPTTTSTTTTSPHKNRQKAATAALHPHTCDPNPPTLPTSDPRAYLISLQPPPTSPSAPPPKTRRAKTSLLPFETLHSDTYIGNLVLSLPTTSIPSLASYKDDDYVSSGTIHPALSVSTVTETQVVAWERTLKALVKEQYRIEGMEADEEMNGELELDLWGALRDGMEEVSHL